MNKWFLPIILAVILEMSVAAQAFDGQRKGFIIGGGLGMGLSSYAQSFETNRHRYIIDRIDKGALISDFKVGYAPTKRIEIYYTSKFSWFRMTNAIGDNVIVADGISGLGVSRYFRSTIPAWFLSGGIAMSTWSLPFEGNSSAWRGFGFYVGGGYEFTRHLDVEANLIWARPNLTENGVKATTYSLSWKFTLNVLAY
ncbi:MAG TPA: hypothetical protein DEO84_07760 [candidate division Zixibacteria bacterium]|nr:hypothetical protein [candidate division Zixibacteria bacterium]HBZ01199.1 hypothetical protein [candidate division Zixibacteria bacterium]